jgi:hypothetical protein
MGVDLSVYGPGDIIGVDPRGIVRLDPKRLASDVESNYLPAIEFDRPDFPWMFTPAAPGPNERLRPWCVLVVVRRQAGVDIAQSRERPLPTLTITNEAKAHDELPDLAESWAWAHAQVITEEDSTEAVNRNLRDQPTLNVSRIVCPRRLEPDRRYYACLVPAFAVGVAAGLGRPVSDTANLAPAWSGDQVEAELPVYYHWEFGTGRGGDFESLATKLHPPTEPLDVGTSRMFIGAADTGLPTLTFADDGAVIEFEGALVGPDHDAPDVVREIPERFLEALAEMLDSLNSALDGEGDLALPIAPPLYGRWHAQTHVVPERFPLWLRELNLDPRYRAVAGLGAEVVRANQEELMHDAWRQVGNILGANRLINLARFAKETSIRLHHRAFASLDADQLFRVTAPLHGRVLLKGSTVRRRVHQSIVPDATQDPAFRRVASARSSLLRRASKASAQPASLGTVKIIDAVNSGVFTANPTRVVPDALVKAAALGVLTVPAAGAVDLKPMGVSRSVDASLLRSVGSQALTVGTPPAPGTVVARPNLSRTGIVTRVHLDAVVRAAASNTTLLTSSTLKAIVDVADESPSAAGFLLPAAGDAVGAVDVDTSGTVTVRPGDDLADELLGRIPARDARRGAEGIEEALEAGRIVLAAPSLGRRPVVPPGPARPAPPAGPSTPPTTAISPTIPPRLVKRPDAIRRLQKAISSHVTALNPAGPVVAEPQPLALDAVRSELLSKTDPGRVIPRRIASMLRVGDTPLAAADARIVRETGALEPLLASPQLRGSMYKPLAAYAQEHFLPGIGRIEANTVGLLKTNPRFVEAFMIGANVELASELLWREFPADRGITPLRHFWDRDDGEEDIPEIADFSAAVKLGTTALGGAKGQMVLLLRGDLLRRYPSTVVYAVRAAPDRKMSTDPADTSEPTMRGFIDPDIAFVGFDLDRDEVVADPGFFFVLQEQATEPRFGFDIPTADDKTVPSAWRDATWRHVAVPPGGHLTITNNPMDGVHRDGATFATTSAHLAAITLQQPVRVAIHARDLIPGGGA